MKIILKNFLLTFTVFIISCNPAGSSFNPNPIPVIPAEIGVGSGTFIFSLPGSPGACKDAWENILRLQLDSRNRPCNLIELMPRLLET